MPEGLLRQAERDRRDPYANARSYRAQQHLDRISTSSGSSAGTTDIPKYTEPSYHYSHREEVMGDGRYLAAVPPSLHSDGIPNQPSGAQRSRKRRKTERTTGQNEAVPGRKRTLKEKSCDLSHSAKPVSLLTKMQEPRLKRSRCSLRQVPSSPAVPPVVLRFRKRGTRPLPGKTTGKE